MTGSKTVLLAGASGVFGRHITRVLSDNGYRVLGLGRGATNEVRADINDRDQLLPAVSGVEADIVIHAATALAKPPTRHRDMTATNRLRTVGMRNLVEAAELVGARKLISENMVFGYGYGPHGNNVLTEKDAVWAPHQASSGCEQIVSAMRVKEELTFATPGLDGVSLRFGLFYGPGGTDAIVSALRKRMMPAPKTATVLPWVHLEDAAMAVLAAIDHGTAGSVYSIVDDEPMGLGTQIALTAAAFGTPKPMALPLWMLRPLGLLSDILRTDLRLSNEKARSELGWIPRFPTVREGLAETARATVEP